MQLAVRLLKQKLVGQENVARERLHNPTVADRIGLYRSKLDSARRMEILLGIEANAALEYWSAWSNLQIQFPRVDMDRVPDHWRVFGSRTSPITKSARLAVNPINAVLSYLYAIVQAEAGLAAAQLGLDPGFGVLHKDTRNRDSLACDLMEPVRPLVDSFVLGWLNHGPLRREWFFEEVNGNCRLMAPFAAWLSETALTWRAAVAPYAEEAAEIFWRSRTKKPLSISLPTRLTQSRRSQAKAGKLVGAAPKIPETKRRCRICGSQTTTGSTYCAKCVRIANRENLLKHAQLGRIATHGPIAEARRSATQARQAEALRNWNPSELPKWLDEDAYRREILPRLANFTVKAIRTKLNISHPYATLIKRGSSIPHPRHWVPLLSLTGYDWTS
jgi:hypothetical protein